VSKRGGLFYAIMEFKRVKRINAGGGHQYDQHQVQGKRFGFNTKGADTDYSDYN
jgi:hypothetical protein